MLPDIVSTVDLITYLIWLIFGSIIDYAISKFTAFIIRIILSIVLNIVEVLVLLLVSPIAKSDVESGLLFHENLSRINVVVYFFWLLVTCVIIIVCIVVGCYIKCSISCCSMVDTNRIFAGVIIVESCILCYEVLTIVFTVLLGYQEDGNAHILDWSSHGGRYRSVILILSCIFAFIDLFFLFTNCCFGVTMTE